MRLFTRFKIAPGVSLIESKRLLFTRRPRRASHWLALLFAIAATFVIYFACATM